MNLPGRALARAFAVVAAFGGAASACGARTELPAPEIGEGGAGPLCDPTETSVVVATIGGGIHHVFRECIGRFDTTWCPSKEEAIDFLEPTHCEGIDEVQCGPIVEPSACCYFVLETCGVT